MRFLAVFLVGLFAPVVANAQQVCGARADFIKQLEENYKEIPVSRALEPKFGTIIERTESDEGTWSILRSYANGKICMIAAGENWESVQPKKTSY